MVLLILRLDLILLVDSVRVPAVHQEDESTPEERSDCCEYRFIVDVESACKCEEFREFQRLLNQYEELTLNGIEPLNYAQLLSQQLHLRICAQFTRSEERRVGKEGRSR